ncbi:lecithin retinol acyltransferase-like [Alosa pseudoharengus]|uniref:lecithin retinol acyltransferase-like n=1 Tax=Alosa pseudoharengus TaxID=34774 RepID=UPI003F8ADF0F
MMLDSLTYLLERVFMLAHFNIFSLIPSEKEKLENCCEASTRVLQRGDLLEVPRTLFTHFGIYLGDNKVAHLIPDIMPVLTSDARQIQKMVTNKRLLLGVLCKKATVRVDFVEDFAYGSPILINSMDHSMKERPLANEEVAGRAEMLIDKVPYSLMWNNCEHFVTYCRYGSAVSLQTEKFLEFLKSIIRDQRSVLLTAFLGLVSIGCVGIAPATTLPALLIPFTLWMAS